MFPPGGRRWKLLGLRQEIKIGIEKVGRVVALGATAWPGVQADLLLLVVWAALNARQEGQRAADLHFITGRREGGKSRLIGCWLASEFSPFRGAGRSVCNSIQIESVIFSPLQRLQIRGWLLVSSYSL